MESITSTYIGSFAGSSFSASCSFNRLVDINTRGAVLGDSNLQLIFSTTTAVP